jgi:UDP-glucuronate 4-epimerase
LHKTILLTGAAGFLGSHLSEALLSLGYKVVGVDNFDPFYPEEVKRKNLTKALAHSDFTFYQGDIRDRSFLEGLSHDFDLLIHIAAKAGVLPSVKNPQEYVSVNIDGTQSLLDFMRKRGVKKYVFASSSSIYGNSKQIPFTESQVVDEPISPYAFTKKSCELMNYTYHHLYGIDTLNLRLFTLYGQRQRPDLSIHKFIGLIEKGQSVDMYGDGSTARDYTHVSDVVNGFVLACAYLFKHNSVFEIINIGNNSPVKLRDLIGLLFELAGKPEKINQLNAQMGDVDITYSNIEKAGRLLGYQPKVSFRDGLADFVKWYRTEHFV